MDGVSFLYLGNGATSTEQSRFTQERIAEQRRQREQQLTASAQGSLAAYYSPGSYPIVRTTFANSVDFAARSDRPGDPSRSNSYYGDMNDSANASTARLASSRSSSSSTSEQAHQNLLSNPFELRHGRRYLRDLPYPLPVDLAEIHRQNLKTLLKCRAFGDRAVCSPHVKTKPPKKVLELACGSGFWSAKCHEYLSSMGHKDISFTGLDVAPLAPDMRKQGVNWKFVQHDLRRVPWPFEDESFDFIMLKDTSLVMPIGAKTSESFIDESLRILAEGGTLEIWETDHTLRSLMPHPPSVAKTVLDPETASRLGVFLILPGTPFGTAQNRYIVQANSWVQDALDRRKMPPAPCTRVAPILYQEADHLGDIGTLRIAIPLGELRWEKEANGSGEKRSRAPSDAQDSVVKGKGKVVEQALTPEQKALRQTALLVMIQAVESLEPILKEASGKNSEEWSHWWAGLMNDLLNPNSGGGVTSEVLEAGAWWATKKKPEP